MSTLATAITERHWDLAAHVLIFAALQTINDEGPVLSLVERPVLSALRTPILRSESLSKGGNPGNGKKKRGPKRKTNHS